MKLKTQVLSVYSPHLKRLTGPILEHAGAEHSQTQEKLCGQYSPGTAGRLGNEIRGDKEIQPCMTLKIRGESLPFMLKHWSKVEGLT